MSKKQEHEDRLRHIIQTVCNVTGCKGCEFDFENEPGCSATELQNRITDKEKTDD